MLGDHPGQRGGGAVGRAYGCHAAAYGWGYRLGARPAGRGVADRAAQRRHRGLDLGLGETSRQQLGDRTAVLAPGDLHRVGKAFERGERQRLTRVGEGTQRGRVELAQQI
ncbi:MAG: hypothetical protein ACRDTM_14570, partial [Micromonosporaceae bacterium]